MITDGLADWKVMQSGGDGFAIDPIGARPLKDYVAYSGT